MTGHTGMLGELEGSHTKAVIYPTYAICCYTWIHSYSMRDTETARVEGQ